MRHDSLRNLLAELCRVAGCKDVEVEPSLLPIKGAQLPPGAIKDDGARPDVIFLLISFYNNYSILVLHYLLMLNIRSD